MSLLLIPIILHAQKGPNQTTTTPPKTKVVRGCLYTVIPGLAEITTINVQQTADKSLLGYDEHQVLFKFSPMEGDKLLIPIETELPFYLRNGATAVLVGQEYIKKKQLKIGNKYAMNLLQTANTEGCLEPYMYESKALDNDLFEALPNIIEYTKQAPLIASTIKEYTVNKTPSIPVVQKHKESNNTISLDEHLNGIDLTTASDEELYEIAKRRIEKNLPNNPTPTSSTSSLNIDSLKAVKRAELLEKYKNQLEQASVIKQPKSLSKTQLIHQKRQADREAAKAQKIAERQAKQAAAQKAALIAQLETKVELEILAEIEQKKAKAIAEQQQKTDALQRYQTIYNQAEQALTEQAARERCQYQSRIAGAIEIVDVKRSSQSDITYEVWVRFKPNNYAQLSRTEQKKWDVLLPFTLDPKGKNAHPTAQYIRRYRVFKAATYDGFAQMLDHGICNQVLLFAPTLPVDEKQLSIK